MRVFLGVDPGASGAIAVINEESQPVDWRGADETPQDLWKWLWSVSVEYHCLLTVIEQVSAMPRQGVSSTFKFGKSAGFLLGLVTAAQLRHEHIRPAAWQGALRCRSKGDKNVTKQKAQELFPSQKMTHKNADAFLLAEYARRCEMSRIG